MLTFPKDSAASSTKWEVNMKRKYRAASSAIVFKITEVLSPVFLDRVTKKMVNEKAKKSAVSTFSAGSVPPGLDLSSLSRTVEERDARIRDFEGSVLDEHAHMVCFEGYRWERLSFTVPIAIER